MKGYTDLEQSRKLSEILSLESADMCYIQDKPKIGFLHKEYKEFGDTILQDYYPCWSLAALLGVMPQEIFDREYIINITEGCDYKWVLTYDHNENKNHSYYGLSTGADNLIDACVEMIIKLNEYKML